MPDQHRHLANKYEYIVNLQGAEAYYGSLWHSLLDIAYSVAKLRILHLDKALKMHKLSPKNPGNWCSVAQKSSVEMCANPGLFINGCVFDAKIFCLTEILLKLCAAHSWVT